MTRRELLALPLLAPLTAAQAERAERLHRQSIVINVHDHMWRAGDINDMRKGGVTAKVYKPLADGVFWDEKNRRSFPKDPFDWTAKYLEMAAAIERNDGVFPVRNLADIEQAKREGKAGIILGNEGSLPLGGSLKGLDRLYERGLRELALYWPAGNHTSHVMGANGRLTQFGHDVVDRANALGILVDTAHLSGSPAFTEVIEQSKAPVVHSHGAARTPRAWTFSEGDLTDEHIRAIAAKGGVIGLHFCTYIKNVNGLNWSPTIEDLMDHVQYLVKAGGIECVGIGADHFPFNREPLEKPVFEAASGFIEDRDWGRTFVEGLDNISGMPLFTKGLVSRGFSDVEVGKILGGNVMRVLKQAWKS